MNKKSLLNIFRGYQFIFLALAFFTVFMLYPLILVFKNSFYEINTLSQESIFIYFSNYVKLFQDFVFLRSLLNTCTYTVAIIILINIPAIIFAIILDRGKIKGNYFLRVVFFVPVILAPVLIGTTFKRIFAPAGALNLILKNLNLGFLTHNWLGVPSLAMVAVILTTVWQCAGWNMVLYYARLKEIPKNLYEAASIDGASEFGIIKHIKLPLIKDILGILVVINIIGGFKVFDFIYIMTHGGPAHKTEVLTSFLYYQAFDFYKWGYASSVAVILFVLVMFFTWLRLRK